MRVCALRHMQCRICRGTDFFPVLDLGSTPLADDFLTLADLQLPETYYPLVVVACASPRCSLVQLTYTVPREVLYSPSYPYVSSTTETGRRHYHAMAVDIIERLGLQGGGLAVDIGSNVGVLLEGFKSRDMRVLGIEPVDRIAQIALDSGIPTCTGFFTQTLASTIVGDHGQASVVTGTNVVAHIDDLHDLAAGIKTLLAPGGVFVFEAPYLRDMLDGLAYDTIYHEHLSYLAVTPISHLFEQYNMEVFDVQWQPIHGGTLRYYIAAKGEHEVQPVVDATRDDERELSCQLLNFATQVEASRLSLRLLLTHIRLQGGAAAAVSAPAKGNTLLNYCGLAGLVDFVTEKAPLKVGRFTPGTHLPVLPDSALLERRPDYALLLAWNFADEIMANHRDYVEAGGKFIIPVPTPRIVQ